MCRCGLCAETSQPPGGPVFVLFPAGADATDLILTLDFSPRIGLLFSYQPWNTRLFQDVALLSVLLVAKLKFRLAWFLT